MTVISTMCVLSEMRNVFITGFMGTGKSCVGEALAARLGREFVDLDEQIVQAAGEQINAIFARQGEAHFRTLEHETLKKLCSGSGFVVSTGGGAVISMENRSLMHDSGVVVNLRASAETIRNRLDGDDKRPLLRDDKSAEKIAAMLEEREPCYADADIRIDTTGRSVEEIVEHILLWLKSHVCGKVSA